MQGLTDAAGRDVRVSFTPHLMPMTRGMESDCYVKLANGASAEDLRKALEVGGGWDTGCWRGTGTCTCSRTRLPTRLSPRRRRHWRERAPFATAAATTALA